MEALTISAANLDTIEKNLGSVAHELSGVINNVNSVNSQVNKVEEKVASLNDEVKNLVKEIREETIINNARQNIMYNNGQIEKKYGYYDKVRRTTESLLDAINNSNISKNAIYNLNQDLLLNNPNYWLSNALAALTSWILNDKTNADKETSNALKKDAERTSIFFCLINYKLGREQTSLNWLNKYLGLQNPMELNKDFITVLDLIATGIFGNQAKETVLNKISEWFLRLNSNPQIEKKNIDTWEDFIVTHEDKNITMPYLELYSRDVQILKNNLAITSSYANVLEELQAITSNENINKSIDEILNNLIYEYESKEQIYQSDNLKNQLIIKCNGNREEAERLFQKEQSIYQDKTNIIELLCNIIIYKEEYKISNATQKLALALQKENILKAYDIINSKLNENSFNITINNFLTTTQDGKNNEAIQKELDLFVNNEFKDDDKDLIIILIILNIIGIVGIFITLNNKVLSTLIIIFLILGNLILLLKLHNRSTLREKSKQNLKDTTNVALEKALAESIDYRNMINADKEYYTQLLVFLNNISPTSYINSNNERNIIVGENNE